MDAKPFSGMVVRPRDFSCSGMAGKASPASPKVDAQEALDVLPATAALIHVRHM